MMKMINLKAKSSSSSLEGIAKQQQLQKELEKSQRSKGAGKTSLINSFILRNNLSAEEVSRKGEKMGRKSIN